VQRRWQPRASAVLTLVKLTNAEYLIT